MMAIRGAFTVASSGKLIETIGVYIRGHEVVILNLSDTVHIDDSAALLVEQLIDTATMQDTHCIAMGLSGSPVRTLGALDIPRRVPKDRIVETLDEARGDCGQGPCRPRSLERAKLGKAQSGAVAVTSLQERAAEGD